MRISFIILFFISLSLASPGQGVAPLGQSPPSIKWNQIQTKHFRIIFPVEITTDAQRIANALDNAYHDVAASLKSFPRKIPIVMQNQTVDNNAFVSSEGRRAEFFSTPPQNPNNMGLNNWYDELSLHEYRHVAQMDQTRTGWGKYIFYLFGNSGTSVMQGLTNPWWFWEGDAVGCETVMGYGGRGRIPSFDLTFRTQLLSRGAFPYLKSACGSLKNAIPNHYLLGYLMTTYAKNHYGADVWSKILTRTYKKPPVPFSFSQSIKKTTGLNAQEMYNEMTKELKTMWSKQLDSIKETPVTNLHTPKEKVFTNYKFPQYLPDGSIIAQKSGLETGSFLAYKSSIVDQSLFVRITKDGKEEKIRMSGVLDDNAVLSSYQDKVAWTEYTYDPRWGARNYTVIKILDVKTKKITQLTRRSRYHAPCFSPDGKTIATVETTTGNKFFLVLLDSETGQVIKKFDNPDNQQFLQPHFTAEGKNILLIYQVPGYKSIVKLNIESGKVTTLLNPVPENLSAPVDYKNFVLYNSPQAGIDNIYAVDTATGNVHRVTDRKFGAFNPCPSSDGNKICFQDFTVDGFRIVEMPAKPEEWIMVKYQNDTTRKVEYFRNYSHQEAGNILTRIPDSTYPTTPYKRIWNAIKVFGWGVDPVTNLPQISLGIRSVDMLSTTSMQAGIKYNSNERELTKYFMMSYQGLYPQFFFTFFDGRRRTIFPEKQGGTNVNGISYDRIHYRNYNLGTQLPLNLSSGPYIRKTNMTIQGGYTDFSTLNRSTNSNGYDKNKLGNFYSMSYDIYFENRLRQSMRDVGPRFGSILQFSFRNTPFKSYFQAKQQAADAILYLPGFFKHHSVRLRYNWQKDDNSTYHFENRYDFVRNKRDQLFSRWNLWSIDYKLQLGYPEAPFLNGLLYFQRIKAAFFAEYGIGKFSFINTNPKNRYYTNLGVELTSDENLLRFLVPFDAGIRVSYLTQNKSVLFGVIVKAPNIF
ncbi:MAG: hypothetical protein HZB42_07560 [Sphingobacteriales bacterium]|nr:hypothetical protein [Sphingobacteriales bacterium]